MSAGKKNALYRAVFPSSAIERSSALRRSARFRPWAPSWPPCRTSPSSLRPSCSEPARAPRWVSSSGCFPSSSWTFAPPSPVVAFVFYPCLFAGRRARQPLEPRHLLRAAHPDRGDGRAPFQAVFPGFRAPRQKKGAGLRPLGRRRHLANTLLVLSGIYFLFGARTPGHRRFLQSASGIVGGTILTSAYRRPWSRPFWPAPSATRLRKYLNARRPPIRAARRGARRGHQAFFKKR